MIDKNKKIMGIIVAPNGEIEPFYFEDYPNYVHFQALRNYIMNKTIDFSLKYDLKLADQKKANGAIETNLYELQKIFMKNGYMLMIVATDYRNAHRKETLNNGWINLPTNLENLKDDYKHILNQLSEEIVINRTGQNENQDPNKLTFFDLTVNQYQKIGREEEFCELGQFNQVLEEMQEDLQRKR